MRRDGRTRARQTLLALCMTWHERLGVQNDSCELDPPHACAWRMASIIFEDDHAMATRAVGGVSLGLGVTMYKGLVVELKARSMTRRKSHPPQPSHSLQLQILRESCSRR